MPTRVDVAAPNLSESIAEAARAVTALAVLCPELSIFASILAGRDPRSADALVVQPGAVTCTDNTVIYIRPDKRLAGVPTDEEWSDIKASLFHEVGHCVFDSFAAVKAADREAAMSALVANMEPSIRRDALAKHIASAEANYKSIATAFHGLMPMLVNALEDARVEYQLFVAKPGTQKHLDRQRMAIFDGSHESISERIGKPWYDRTDDEQIIVGCYMIGAGYAPEGRLSEHVARDLRSVEPFIKFVSGSSSMPDVYYGTFTVLSELQKLGYLRNGDERDAPIGPTDHEDIGPDTPMQRAEDSGCPHPHSMIIECEAEGCRGNCTQCGCHLIEIEGDNDGDMGRSDKRPDGRSGSDGLAGSDGDGPDADDAEMDSGVGRGTRQAYDESETFEGGSPGAPVGRAGSTGDDDGSGHMVGSTDTTENVRGAGRVEELREHIGVTPTEVQELLNEAGGHGDQSAGTHALAEKDVTAAITLLREGYGVDEQPALGVVEIRRDNELIRPSETLGVDRSTVESAIARVLPELRQVLVLNGATGFTPGLRSGHVDTRSLYRTATGDNRVFGRFTTSETRNYVFCLAADCSGSMGDSRSPKMRTMKHTLLAAADMLDRCGVPFICFGYSGDNAARGPLGTYKSGYDSGYRMIISDVRDENSEWDNQARARLFALGQHAANLDGSTMQYARVRTRRLIKRPDTTAIIIYANDGGMPAENKTNEQRLIAWEVANQQRNGVHYIGLGINSNAVQRAGLELVACNNPQQGCANITAKIAEILGVHR